LKYIFLVKVDILLPNMRVSRKTVNKHLKKEIDNALITTVADLKTPEQIETFLKDFLTTTEYEMFSKRLAIAYWLTKGRSYANIRENLKVSSATIASVQEHLVKDGFKLAMKIMQADEWAQKWAGRIKKIVKTS